jgi:hypothetical protein
MKQYTSQVFTVVALCVALTIAQAPRRRKRRAAPIEESEELSVMSSIDARSGGSLN